MSTMPHAVEPVDSRRLRAPALGALLLLSAMMYIVAFDQGLLESGGVLHEFFHDARHMLGVPCH
jgi:hypothetical protein